MKATEEKKVSLVKYSVYAIALYLTILLGQFYIIIKNALPIPSAPVFIGPIYLPTLITGIMMLLLLAAGVLMMKQHKYKEAEDELAHLNNYKAGYITKYISIFVIPAVILLVKDFNLMPEEDIVGNILSVFLICSSVTELIHNIVFIVLEKKQNWT